MSSLLKSAAIAAVAPKVLKNVRWQWVLYGAAAYFAVKFLVQRGILPASFKKQNYIDVEATSYSEKIDLGDYRPSDVAQQQNFMH